MRTLREEAPIYWAPKNALWVVSKYEDIVEISKNPELFCSGQGIRPGIPVRQALIDEDDPKHCRLRCTINCGFTPRRVKLLEQEFETFTREAIDSVSRTGRFDFVESIAVPLPAILIAEMIGIPKLDHHRFHQWSDAMMRADGHCDDTALMARAGKAAQEYSISIEDVIEKHRVEPREDLISALVVNNVARNVPWYLPSRAATLLASYLGSDPDYQPYGVQKFEWDENAQSLRDAWVNRDISSPNCVPIVSYPSDRVYRIGARDNRWTLEALEWRDGRSAFHSVIGGQRYNPFFSGTELDEVGRIHYGTPWGRVRLVPTANASQLEH